MEIKRNIKKVLWVDDDSSHADSYRCLAFVKYGIDLVPFTNWLEAEKALLEDFDQWEGIILDAKCRYRADETGYEASTFLPTAVMRISDACAKHKRQIPWLILSGGDEEGIDGIEKMMRNVQRDWLEDGDPVYYPKAMGIGPALEKIVSLGSASLALQITNALYPHVFNAIRESGLPVIVRESMIGLLKAVLDPIGLGADANLLFGKARIVAESIIKGLMEKGFLPSQACHRDGTVNMNWCSLALQGESSEIDGKVPANVAAQIKECRAFGAMPKIMASNLKSILLSCGDNLHAQPRYAAEKRPYSTKEYAKATSNSPYLIGSFALQLCDMIVWYAGFANVSHPAK